MGGQTERSTGDWIQPKSNLLHIENRKLAILDRIKAQGGPFSSAKEIDNYLLTTDDNLKTKTNQQEMKIHMPEIHLHPSQRIDQCLES